MSQSSTAPDEPERDAFLREALRHAPDAELAPPQAVSAAILRQARAAPVRSAAATSAPPFHRLAALWAWLARPPVTAAFASVMVAGVVGLMWWDRPIDDPAFRPSPSPSPSPAPATATAPPARLAPPSAEQAPAAAQKLPPAAPPSIAIPATTPAPDTAKSKAQARKPAPERREPVAADVPPPSTTPSALPAPAEPPAMPAAAPAAPAAVKAAPTEPPAQAEAAAAPAAARSAELRMAPAGRAAATTAMSSFADRASGQRTMAALRAAIAREPQRWTWQRDGRAAQSMNEAVTAWIAALDAAAGARWAEATTPAAETAPAAELRLLLDGRPRHVLQLDRDGARWQSIGAISFVLQASLPAAGMRTLEQTAP